MTEGDSNLSPSEFMQSEVDSIDAAEERADQALEGLPRALGLAQAIAQARPYPPDVDGVRDVAAEIATLIEASLDRLTAIQHERDSALEDLELVRENWQAEAERLREALTDLLDVIDEQNVEGTCTIGTCHWPAVTRQANLAREDLGSTPESDEEFEARIADRSPGSQSEMRRLRKEEA
jgi:DNA-directed RNA polymerase subunit F